MKLQDVFTQLTFTELRQISIADQDAGVINKANQHIVLGHLNMALAAIHTRFTLKEGQLKLHLQPNVYAYTLNSRHDLNNPFSSNPQKYIEVPGGQFKDDLLKVESVRLRGEDLELNTGAAYACSTPKHDVLVVDDSVVGQDPSLPDYLKGTVLDVRYRANHPKFEVDPNDALDPEEEEVDIPYPYLEPVLYYIAGRVHHPAALSGEFQLGASYAAKYEQACQRLEMMNVQTDKVPENDRLHRNGWV